MITHNDPLWYKDAIIYELHIKAFFDANLDLAAKYKIPLERGVPAMAVLDEGGKLLYSQRSGEFESMRRVDPSAVNTFLAQWKPTRAGCSVIMVNC